MAKPRGKGWKPVPTRGTFTPDPAEVESEVPETSPEVIPQEIEELLADLPQETVVKVARWDEKAGDFKHAGLFPVQGFSLDMLAKQRGAGKFRLRIWGPKLDPETGKTKMHEYARRIEHIDESLAPVVAEPEKGRSWMDAALMQMMDMNMKTMQLMLTAMGQRESASQVVAALAPLVNKSEPRTERDRLLELLILRSMKEKGGDFESMLAVLEKGMELAQGKEVDPLATVGMELVRLVARGTGQPVPRALPPGASSAAEVPAPEVRELPPEQRVAVKALEDLVKEVGPLFARVSKAGLDNVDVYADVLCDAVERRPELDPHLDAWFGDVEYPTMVLPLFPEVDGTWLAAVLLKARELLTGDQDDDADQARAVDRGDRAAPAGRPGDGTDVGGDATAGQRGPDRASHPKSSRLAIPRVRPEP